MCIICQDIWSQINQSSLEEALKQADLITSDLELVFNTKLEDLLITIEKTSMSKLYKIPVLMSFVADSRFRPYSHISDIVLSFKEFYSNQHHAKELINKTNKNILKDDDSKLESLIQKNPVKFLCKSHSAMFSYDKNTKTVSLSFSQKDIELAGKIHSVFVKQIQDRLKYRVVDRISRWKY